MIDSTTAGGVMNKALDMLKALADQMGVTLQYLWPRYTTYQAARAVADAVTFGIAMLLSGILVLVFIRWLCHDLKEAPKHYSDERGVFPGFMAVIFGVVCIFCTVTFLGHIGNAIAAAMSPEGYALAQLMTKLK